MLALIMAGGRGTRLNKGEKPLVSIYGAPMISYVHRALTAARLDPVVVTSPQTPMTFEWCKANGIERCHADGRGFIEDTIQAVQTLGEHHPVFVCVSDIPCVTCKCIQFVAESYRLSGKEACSSWVPSYLFPGFNRDLPYLGMIDGIEAYPAGVNILRGDIIKQPQQEVCLLIHDPGLALNVNTHADLAAAEDFLKRKNNNSPE
jgi:adenosylcobinamide-phosphate guanylyltransferase